MKYKFLSMLLTIAAVVVAATPMASAHVMVTPKTAEPAQEVIFSVSVPNEKDIPMTSLRLALPAGLHDVIPTAQAGWTVSTEKSGDETSSITWADGNLAGGQRADFSFQAQTPEKAGEVQWKAYQTFADGSTISWDQKPALGGSESESSGPYSVTSVQSPKAASGRADSNGTSTAALGLSLLALLLSIFTLLRIKRSARS